MKDKSEGSIKLYKYMLDRGLPEGFCDQITKNLNTDWTAGRMLGYLKNNDKVSLEDIADEMLAILYDRNSLIEKHENERANAAWNEFLNR